MKFYRVYMFNGSIIGIKAKNKRQAIKKAENKCNDIAVKIEKIGHYVLHIICIN